MNAFDVYSGRRLIDTVFYNDRCDGGAKITANDVRKSLINHDGYPEDIFVRKVCKRRSRQQTTGIAR